MTNQFVCRDATLIDAATATPHSRSFAVVYTLS